MDLHKSIYVAHKLEFSSSITQIELGIIMIRIIDIVHTSFIDIVHTLFIEF